MAVPMTDKNAVNDQPHSCRNMFYPHSRWRTAQISRVLGDDEMLHIAGTAWE
jgi:hypothetical protein